MIAVTMHPNLSLQPNPRVERASLTTPDHLSSLVEDGDTPRAKADDKAEVADLDRADVNLGCVRPPGKAQQSA